VLARTMFAIVDFAARKGFADAAKPTGSVAQSAGAGGETANLKKTRARRTGVRGETYAYWYLRSHGYVLVARNFRSPSVKGEIDMVGHDGNVLAFVEVKTRVVGERELPSPEVAVTPEKRHALARIARHFLRARRAESAPYRFDVLAIESRVGTRPTVRLHKAAFTPGAN
jgi:putative endonuclease